MEFADLAQDFVEATSLLVGGLHLPDRQSSGGICIVNDFCLERQGRSREGMAPG